MKYSIVLTAIVLSAVSLSLASTTDKQAWVVNGNGRSVSIIDIPTETVTGTIPLTQGAAVAEAGAIDFSTVDGSGGAFAFVTQGSVLHVIDASLQTIQQSVDVGVQLGLSVVLVDVRSAQNREFDAGGATATVQTYLYAAANVDLGAGQVPEPYYIVLDQNALIGATPGPTVVDFGPLIDPAVPAASRGEATGVAVLGAPAGDAFQRVWFSTRTTTAPALARTVLVTKGSSLSSAWTVGRTVETSLGAGTVAAGFSRVGVPYDREQSILPTGRDGRLVSLDHGGECVIGGDLRQVAIAGPGPGGYQLLAIDGTAEEVYRINGATCDFDGFAVGQNPVDLAIDETAVHGTAFVVNQDSDSVTILRPDETVVEVALGQGGPGSCVQCPTAVAIRKCCVGCSVKSLTVAPSGVPSGVNDYLSWFKIGCLNCDQGVFCQCAIPDDPSCPCWCDPDTAPSTGVGSCYENLPPAAGGPDRAFVPGGTLYGAGPGTSTPWIQLGITTGSNFTNFAVGTYTLKYVVLPVSP